MLKLIKEIATTNENIIFVGGVAEIIHGTKKTTNDIDIVVLSLNGLEKFGKINEFETKSILSKSGKRAFIKNEKCQIDIFIENELPEFIQIDDVKYETKKSLINHYEFIFNNTNDPELKKIFETKIKRLKL